MRRLNRSRGVALAAVLAVAFAVHSKESAEQADDDGRGYAEHDWLFAGGNWSSSRYSTLADISTETIDRLGGAWVKRLDGGASSRATPVVKDGVIYLTAGANVFAIDAGSGEPVWRWQPDDAEAGMVPSWQGVGLGRSSSSSASAAPTSSGSAGTPASSRGSHRSAACREKAARSSRRRRCRRTGGSSPASPTATPAGRAASWRSMQPPARSSGPFSSCRVPVNSGSSPI